MTAFIGGPPQDVIHEKLGQEPGEGVALGGLVHLEIYTDDSNFPGTI